MHAVNAIIARHQFTAGNGSVILYQVENEYIGKADRSYMAALERQVRADGITVPLTHNSCCGNGAQWARGVGAVGATGIYTAADSGALAIYCQMWARFREAETADPYVPLPASFLSALSAAGSKLGLDPAARAKLGAQPATAEAQPQDPDDAWAKLEHLRLINAGKAP